MDKRLLEILVCPLCKGKLLLKKQEVICRFDRLAFPIRDNIPIMLEQEARSISLEEKDTLYP
ncbi:MAG: Trm112 family protein [Legionellales bacterium]